MEGRGGDRRGGSWEKDIGVERGCRKKIGSVQNHKEGNSKQHGWESQLGMEGESAT